MFLGGKEDADGIVGSSIKYVLITEAVAQRKTAPIYLARGQQHKFQSLIAAEEEEWEARMRKEKGDNTGDGNNGGGGAGEIASAVGSFEEYREKGRAAGVM